MCNRKAKIKMLLAHADECSLDPVIVITDLGVPIYLLLNFNLSTHAFNIHSKKKNKKRLKQHWCWCWYWQHSYFSALIHHNLESLCGRMWRMLHMCSLRRFTYGIALPHEVAIWTCLRLFDWFVRKIRIQLSIIILLASL